MSTYCGKECDTCTYKAELSCSGCQSGPGRMISGDCKLARCCRDKGHETCETCGLKRNCGIWLDKGNIPKQRIDRIQEDKEKEELIWRRAPFLGKWLWLLFWLVVPRFISNFLTGDTMVAIAPSLENVGRIGQILCACCYSLILFKISKEHKSYLIAAAVGFGSVAIDILDYCLNISDVWILTMLAVVQMAVVLVADYYEYKAHADVVLVVDGNISEQWDKFWNWNFYSSIGLIVSLFLIVMIPFVGVLTTLASVIGMLVAGIKKLVCLYRTAQIFRARMEQERG